MRDVVSGAASADGVEPAPLGHTTVAALVGELAGRLMAGGALDPALDAREIVASLHDAPRFWPSVNGHVTVDPALRARALRAADLRLDGAPMAYATGRAAFRSLALAVDERVLIPRPETELLVDLVLAEVPADARGLVVDACTGSGALAIALALEGGFARVVATDLSADALAVASANVQQLAPGRVELRQGDLLSPMLPGELASVVVANPPYIAHHEALSLPRSVRDWEPALALYSGADGMDATVRLLRQALAVLAPGGLLAMEVDSRRALLVVEAAARTPGYRDIAVRMDLTGRERFVLARRTETQ
jgi:release factor glutamine methyltransferase